MKVLQVIDQAFRTTTEEQDDTILWLTRSMRSVGGELTVLLAGHGTNYAVLKTAQPSLTLGKWHQSQPADLPKDINQLIDSGVPVFIIEEDFIERGLQRQSIIQGVQTIARHNLPVLYEHADQVWQW
ncbi:hypothetical protein [Zhongshania marina]|uniref:DsrE family protein n=1 Tax=Zhongshania marina TaxID=2304603 RepID=A0A2S4HEC8_9GAMM|nr:hypothetical protein [Marortus luteolus]POP52279.1 hypothetical protein C0068_12950 [Marortus luteolus]